MAVASAPRTPLLIGADMLPTVVGVVPMAWGRRDYSLPGRAHGCSCKRECYGDGQNPSTHPCGARWLRLWLRSVYSSKPPRVFDRGLLISCGAAGSCSPEVAVPSMDARRASRWFASFLASPTAGFPLADGRKTLRRCDGGHGHIPNNAGRPRAPSSPWGSSGSRRSQHATKRLWSVPREVPTASCVPRNVCSSNHESQAKMSPVLRDYESADHASNASRPWWA